MSLHAAGSMARNRGEADNPETPSADRDSVSFCCSLDDMISVFKNSLWL